MRQLVIFACILICGAIATPDSNACVPSGNALNVGKNDTPKTQKVFSQYDKLRKALDKYEGFAKRGGWRTISITDSVYRLGDQSATVRLVRKRLFAEDYLLADSGSAVFDSSLVIALNQFKERHNLTPDSIISKTAIAAMNVSISDRINTIRVNMERARLVEADENRNFIAVNIPSFKLYYFKKGVAVLNSKVVVGKEATKTVVFNDTITEIVFSPYWNVPASIAKNELLPTIKKYPKLFAQMDLEWHNGKLRQRPGVNNALGLVKFLFPNSNNIYLHDTPLKSLFKEEKRAFSHGCIRVEKACELAALIMSDEYGWTEIETQAAMKPGKQKAYFLKNKIPIYIAYFTAWADAEGNVSFYPDVYGHD